MYELFLKQNLWNTFNRDRFKEMISQSIKEIQEKINNNLYRYRKFWGVSKIIICYSIKFKITVL